MLNARNSMLFLLAAVLVSWLRTEDLVRLRFDFMANAIGCSPCGLPSTSP